MSTKPNKTMSLKNLIAAYAGYNLWANETLIAWLKTKPEQLLDTPVPSSFAGIRLTLSHIRDCEQFWAGVIAADGTTGSHSGNNILEELVAASRLLNRLIAGYTEQELAEEVQLETPWVSGRLPRHQFILHVITHSTYHRGQVITIGRALDVTDAPMTDYNFYNMARDRVFA